jgi:hypothetical protein
MLTSGINRVNSKKILIGSRMPKENKSSIVVTQADWLVANRGHG